MVWVLFALCAFSLLVLTTCVKILLRKTLHIEKEKLFSYNHVNALHKKIDFTIRLISVLILLYVLYLIMFQEHTINLFLITGLILFIIECGIKTFFEWKYSPNPKESLLTISEMVILATTILIIIQLDVLKLN